MTVEAFDGSVNRAKMMCIDRMMWVIASRVHSNRAVHHAVAEVLPMLYLG